VVEPQTDDQQLDETMTRRRIHDALENIIEDVSKGEEVTVTTDEPTNSLLVHAPPARMEEIARLIEALDVANVRASQAENLVYRVYMVEIPSKDGNLKVFSLILERPSQLPSTDLLDALKGADLQIGTFLQSNEWSGKRHVAACDPGPGRLRRPISPSKSG
jgi:hypothetical protein